MDFSSNLRARAFLLLKMLESSAKRRRRRRRRRRRMQTGDAFTNDPFMAIFVFFKY